MREFSKYMGQLFTEDGPEGLDAKVLRAGCNPCRALTWANMEILTELQLLARVDRITDMKGIARCRVMGSPPWSSTGSPWLWEAFLQRAGVVAQEPVWDEVVENQQEKEPACIHRF